MSIIGGHCYLQLFWPLSRDACTWHDDRYLDALPIVHFYASNRQLL